MGRKGREKNDREEVGRTNLATVFPLFMYTFFWLWQPFYAPSLKSWIRPCWLTMKCIQLFDETNNCFMKFNHGARRGRPRHHCGVWFDLSLRAVFSNPTYKPSIGRLRCFDIGTDRWPLRNHTKGLLYYKHAWCPDVCCSDASIVNIDITVRYRRIESATSI